MIRALIVDDERLARQRLRRLLGQHPEVEIIGECGDGPSAIAALQETAPDLLLLDIQMPGMDGFGVVGALGTRSQPISFLSRPSINMRCERSRPVRLITS